jgi:hypothetical protein
MLFIVTATVTITERGIESDSSTTRQVIHVVDATDDAQALDILHRHYEQQSDTSGPYGTRFAVSDAHAHPPLSLASLALSS